MKVAMLGSLFRYLGNLFGAWFGRRGPETPRGEAILTLRLLQNTRVQTELGFTAEQLRIVRQTIRTARESRRGELEALRARGDQEFATGMPALQAAVATEVSNELARAAVFNSNQYARLQQIILQNRGPAVFGDPVVQMTLGISGEQKAALRSLVEDSRRRNREMMREGAPGAVRREAMDQALALLTDEQHSQWNEMIGRPFSAGGSEDDQV